MTGMRAVLLYVAMGMTSLNNVGNAAAPGGRAAPTGGADAPAAAAEAEVVAGNNAFALDLYAVLRDGGNNLFISPYSISTALAMTYAGARGETAEEMAHVLHFTLEPPRLHAAFSGQVQRLATYEENGRRQVKVANALWAGRDADLLPDYVELVKEFYDGTTRNIDFSDVVQACRTINDWVEKQTEDKIKDLLDPDAVRDAILVLTNAIHFKGTWQTQFDARHTRDAPFHVSADREVMVPLMHQKGSLGYLSGGNVDLLELPYSGERLSMVVLLPKQVDGLAELEDGLTAGRVNDWTSRLQKREVAIFLPKFELKSNYTLSGPLKAMGMRKAFGRAADFTEMTSGGAFISEVVHQAFVKVDEEGTEAAAATAVKMKRAAVAPTPTFRADHPFLFLIRDRATGGILFLGRVVDPTA